MIRFRAVPVGELLSSLLSKDRYEKSMFLHKLKEGFEGENIQIKNIWGKALEETVYLNTDDKEIILSVGNNLGDTDTEGQLSMLTMASELIGKNLDTAVSEKLKSEKLVLSMWMFTGIGIGIMVI